MLQFKSIQADALYAQKELAALGITYSRQHLRVLARKGEFPAALKIGRGQNARNLWLGSELLAFINQRVKLRDTVLETRRMTKAPV